MYGFCGFVLSFGVLLSESLPELTPESELNILVPNVTRSPQMRQKSFLGEFEGWLKSHSAPYSDENGAKIVALLPKLTEICLPKGRDPRKCISEKLVIKR